MISKEPTNKFNNKERTKHKFKNWNVNIKSQTKFMRAFYQGPFNSFWE